MSFFLTLILLLCSLGTTIGFINAAMTIKSSTSGYNSRQHRVSWRLLCMNSKETALGIVEAAVQTRNIDKQEVVRALQMLERSYKDKPIPETAIKGQWELVFTNSALAQEAGFLLGGYLGGYFPTREVINFNDNGIITLKGGFLSRYQGESKIVSSRPLILEYVFKDFKIGPIGQDGMAQKVRGYQFIYIGDVNGITVTRILPSGSYAILKRCT